jgi:peptide/nickel transport system permease protein
MLRFILRRLLAIPITLLVITTILHGIIMLAPAERRASLYMGRRLRSSMSMYMEQNMLNKIIQQYGLDDPYPVQYARWLSL